MDRLSKALILWRVLTVVSLVSIVVGTPLLAFFALRGLYLPMVLFILIVAHGFYGFPYYFRASRRARIMLALLGLLNDGVTDTAAISESTRLSAAGQAKYLSLLTKKGYLTK